MFLHIGLHKSGTTFLQETFKANADALRGQGVYFPAGPKEPSVVRAVDDLHGRRQVKADNARAVGAWSALVGAARDSGQPLIVLSDERLSLSGLPAIRAVGRSFEADDVQVVVTVRDLARTLMSSWEEAVRSGATWTWDEYVAAIRDPDRRGINPARGFWVRQDLGHITAAWEPIVPNESIVLVTVPPPDSAPDGLLARFCSALGIDPQVLSAPPARTNPAIGLAATEMLRRFNERFADRLDRRQYDRLVKYTIVPQLTANPVGAVGFDQATSEWLGHMADEQIATVHARGYRVVGDLADLRPAPAVSAPAEQVTEMDIAAAAIEALGTLAERRPRGGAPRAVPCGARGAEAGGAASRVRSAGFAVRRWVLVRGDRGGPLGALVARAYRVREWRQERAMRAARDRRRDPAAR